MQPFAFKFPRHFRMLFLLQNQLLLAEKKRDPWYSKNNTQPNLDFFVARLSRCLLWRSGYEGGQTMATYEDVLNKYTRHRKCMFIQLRAH